MTDKTLTADELAKNLYDEPMADGLDQRFVDVPGLVLNDVEKGSALFKKLSKHFRKELNNLRNENDNRELDAIATANLRGKIAKVKEFLALGDEPKGQNESDGPDLGY